MAILTPIERLVAARAAAYGSIALNVKALLARKKDFYIGQLTLDAVVTENHSFEMELSEHPIHRGADILDHKRRKLRSLTMVGIISDYHIRNPLDAMAALPRAPEKSWDLLQKMAESEELFDVYTTMGLYENMAIQRISFERAAQSTHHIEFTAQLREVILVSSTTTTAPADRTERGGLVEGGSKTGKTVVNDDSSLVHIGAPGAVR